MKSKQLTAKEVKKKQVERMIKDANLLIYQMGRLPAHFRRKKDWSDTVLMLAQFIVDSRKGHSKAIKKGLKEAKASGVKLGNRRKPKVSVTKLRALRRQGLSQVEIAKRYKVSQGWISRKLKGEAS